MRSVTGAAAGLGLLGAFVWFFITGLGAGRASPGFDCLSVTEIPLQDCQALVAIYSSTNGPGWLNSGGWLATDTPCSTPWYGVECENEAVSDLNLGSNNLIGSIPPEIGDFSALRSLILQDNSLTGGLPDEIGNLSLLDWLSLSTNQLSGSLPDSLGNLTLLSILWLDNNQFSGNIPASFGNFTQISSLTLFDNQLSGNIPSELGSLASLQDLELHNNRLSGPIPAALGSLTNLFFLLLQNNALEDEIPPALSALTPTVVDFGYNRLNASDPGLIAWLSAHDPDWDQTQTVAPADLATGSTTAGSVQLNWNPILYTADGGYYEVFFATNSAGPYTLHGITGDKAAAGYTAGGLAGGTTYYFCVRTFTPQHGSQQNDLWSDLSGPVDGTTDSPGPGCSLPPTPTATPTATLTPSPTASSTPSPTPSPTITASPTLDDFLAHLPLVVR